MGSSGSAGGRLRQRGQQPLVLVEQRLPLHVVSEGGRAAPPHLAPLGGQHLGQRSHVQPDGLAPRLLLLVRRSAQIIQKEA